MAIQLISIRLFALFLVNAYFIAQRSFTNEWPCIYSPPHLNEIIVVEFFKYWERVFGMVDFIAMYMREWWADQDVRQLNEFNLKSSGWFDSNVQNAWGVQFYSGNFQWIDWGWNRLDSAYEYNSLCWKKIFVPCWDDIGNLHDVLIIAIVLDAF